MNAASVGFHCPMCAGTVPIGRARGSRIARRPTGWRDLEAGQTPVTRALVFVNVVVFLLTLVAGGSISSGGGDLTIDYGLVGYGRIRTGFLIDHIGVAEGEWWRIVTSAFLHGGIIHLAFNMFLLWMIGHQLERNYGPGRYLGLVLGSLTAGSLGVMLLDPLALTVGASGAVFGLMGATVALQVRRGISPWSTGIGSLLLVNLLFTFARPNISIGGHLGGLLGGLALGWAVDEADRRGSGRAVGSAVPVVFTMGCAAVTIWAAGRWWDPLLGLLPA